MPLNISNIRKFKIFTLCRPLQVLLVWSEVSRQEKCGLAASGGAHKQAASAVSANISPPLYILSIFSLYSLSILSLYILFIFSLHSKVLLLCFWIRNSDESAHNKKLSIYAQRTCYVRLKKWGQFWQKCDALNFWLPFSANLTKPWCVWVKMCIQLQHLSHLASFQTVSIRIYNSTSLSNISIFLWV